MLYGGKRTHNGACVLLLAVLLLSHVHAHVSGFTSSQQEHSASTTTRHSNTHYGHDEDSGMHIAASHRIPQDADVAAVDHLEQDGSHEALMTDRNGRSLQQASGSRPNKCKMPPSLINLPTTTTDVSCFSKQDIEQAQNSGDLKGVPTSPFCPCTSLPKFRWLQYAQNEATGLVCLYECPAGYRCSRLALEATSESASSSDAARHMTQAYQGLGTAYGLCVPCTVGEYCEAGTIELTARDMMECEEEARRVAQKMMEDSQLLAAAPPLPNLTAAPPFPFPPGQPLQFNLTPPMPLNAGPPRAGGLAPPGVSKSPPGVLAGGGTGRRLMQTQEESQLVYKQCNSLRLCPAGMYCPRPNETKPCEQGFYCSGASVRPRTCNMVQALTENPFATVWTAPNFLFRSAQDSRTPLSGNFCPAQSASPFGRCDAGHVCTDPGSKSKCKKGHYCPQGSYTQRKCTFIFNCDEGSHRARWGWTGLGLLAFILIGIFVALQLVIRARLRKVLAQQKEESLVDFVTSLGFYVGRQKTEVPVTLWARVCNFFQRDETRSCPSSTSSRNAIMSREEGAPGFGVIDVRLSVSFRNLTLKIHGGKQCVLKDVTGEFPHSQMHALMGPSGCGKSTFMNTLCGKASYGQMSGQATIREMRADGTSQSYSFESLRYLTGYVPQEDIVHEVLTVRENLYFAAKLRLPRDTDKKALYDIVNCIIHLLGLAPVEYSIVGSVEKRGISGGQRKRVNIGMELVARPSLIFLDEPTSGLDSAVSHDVLASLRKMTQAGMNVIMVIHQPRYSIFEMFDSVLLLGVGGRTVFLGPVSLAMPYFTHLGFPLPRNENPADFYLDVISGAVSRVGDEDFVPNQLFDFWEQVGDKWVQDNKEALLRGEEVQVGTPEGQKVLGNFLARAWPWRPKDLQTIHDRFNILDVNHDGFLNFDEFLQFWSGMNNIMTVEEYEAFVDEMIRDFGISKEQMVTRDNFMATVKAKLRQAAGEDVESPTSTAILQTMATMERRQVVESIKKGEAKSRKKLLHTGSSSRFKDIMGQQFQNVRDKATMQNVTEQAKVAGTAMVQEAWGTVAMMTGLKSGGRALPTVWRQIYLIILRDRTKSLNQFLTFLFDILLLAFFAAIIALVQGDVSNLIRLTTPLTMMLATFSLLMSVTALRTFGQENVLFLQRECLGGLSTPAYTLGHMLWDILYMIPRPIIFLVFYLFMLWPEALSDTGLFMKMVAVMLLVAWYSYAFGYMMSVMLDKQVAMVAAAGLPLIFGAIINGLSPRLPEVNPGSPMDLLNHLSYGRWAVEGIIISVAQNVYRNQTEAPLVYGYFRTMGFCDGMSHVRNFTEVMNARNTNRTSGGVVAGPPPPPYPPGLESTQLPFGDIMVGPNLNGSQGGGLQDSQHLSPSTRNQVDELSKVIYFYNEYQNQLDFCDRYFNKALLWLFFLGVLGRVITFLVIKYKVMRRATK